MAIRMKNDPRFPDPGVSKPELASDMPARRSTLPHRPLPPQSQALTVEDMQPESPSPSRLGGFGGKGQWAVVCGLSALVGSLIGSYWTAGTTQSRIDRSEQRQLLAQTIERLVSTGADVQGDLTLSPSAENHQFKSVNFSDITSSREMRKAVRFAAALPGIRKLSFFNPLNTGTGSTAADESVLAVIAEHFPTLDTLDLSCANISAFQAYEGKSVRHLKIVNTPLIMESFTSLKFINGVTELSVGWPDRSLPKDSLLRSDAFHKGLVDAMATMIDLKKINLYDFPLDKEDREKLQKFEITSGRLGD